MTISVLHLRSSSGFFGAERVIITLMANAMRESIKPSLACIENYISGDQSLLVTAQEEQLDVVEIPCRSRLDPGMIHHLRQICKSKCIDIIHTHDYKSLFYGIIVSKWTGCQLVTTIHGKTSGDVKNRLYEFIENRMLGFSDHITVVSRPLLEDFCNAGLETKTSFIANGVDENHFKSTLTGLGKTAWGFDEDCFLFGTIARMSEEKGHHLLIEAFATLLEEEEQARLLLIGDGPLEEELKVFAVEKKLSDKIYFAGPRKEIAEILNDIDCYVSPSYTEGMPMSILEAMASALPIVATEVGAVGQMLSENAGVLIKVGDAEALTQKMQVMIHESEQRKLMGENARLKIESNYSASIQRREYAAIYTELAGTSSNG